MLYTAVGKAVDSKYKGLDYGSLKNIVSNTGQFTDSLGLIFVFLETVGNSIWFTRWLKEVSIMAVLKD